MFRGFFSGKRIIVGENSNNKNLSTIRDKRLAIFLEKIGNKFGSLETGLEASLQTGLNGITNNFVNS